MWDEISLYHFLMLRDSPFLSSQNCSQSSGCWSGGKTSKFHLLSPPSVGICSCNLIVKQIEGKTPQVIFYPFNYIFQQSWWVFSVILPIINVTVSDVYLFPSQLSNFTDRNSCKFFKHLHISSSVTVFVGSERGSPSWIAVCLKPTACLGENAGPLKSFDHSPSCSCRAGYLSSDSNDVS